MPWWRWPTTSHTQRDAAAASALLIRILDRDGVRDAITAVLVDSRVHRRPRSDLPQGPPAAASPRRGLPLSTGEIATVPKFLRRNSISLRDETRLKQSNAFINDTGAGCIFHLESLTRTVLRISRPRRPRCRGLHFTNRRRETRRPASRRQSLDCRSDEALSPKGYIRSIQRCGSLSIFLFFGRRNLKKPKKVLFRKCQLKSISEIKSRLATINELQRSLAAKTSTLARLCPPHPRFKQ